MSARVRSRIIFVILALVVLSAIAAVAVPKLTPKAKSLPTARVQRGVVQLSVQTTGELRAVRSTMLQAPPVGGGLQIVTLAKTGAQVKAGDLVIEFDPAEQEYNLEQAHFRLREAEQEIVRSKAEAEVQTAQDKVALLKARFAVRRAELEVQKNELVSEIDRKKNSLNLEEAKRRLEQLEQDVNSRAASSKAALAVLEAKRNEARIAMQQAEQNIANMQVKAPMDGLVSIRENRDASGGFFFQGMVLPEYREGDSVNPGSIIAEVLDTNGMQVSAKVNEADRSNVNVGQSVEVSMHGSTSGPLPGKVQNVAGLASRNFWDSGSTRKFDIAVVLDRIDGALRPGSTGEVVVRGSEVKDALFVPRQAVFDKDGKPVVYVRNGNGFAAQEVKIVSRTTTRVVVENLGEGTEVALVNPELDMKKSGGKPAAAPSFGGGR